MCRVIEKDIKKSACIFIACVMHLRIGVCIISFLFFHPGFIIHFWYFEIYQHCEESSRLRNISHFNQEKVRIILNILNFNLGGNIHVISEIPLKQNISQKLQENFLLKYFYWLISVFFKIVYKNIQLLLIQTKGSSAQLLGQKNLDCHNPRNSFQFKKFYILSYYGYLHSKVQYFLYFLSFLRFT